MTTSMKVEESTPRSPPDGLGNSWVRLDPEDDKIPTMISYWDCSLHNRFGNRAYAQWLGIDPRALVGMHLRDVLAEERYLVNLPYMEAALSGQEQQFEDLIADPNGKQSWYLLVQYVPDFVAGQVQGVYVMVSDITPLKRVQAALTTFSLYRERNSETGGQMKRIQLYLQALAHELARTGYYTDQLSEQQIELIVKAAPMHDLGNVGIPDNILQKLGRYTPEETVVMRTHATIGESILRTTASAGDASDSLLLAASRIAGAHHENWDGSGYPRGLRGQDIALEARLMALADVYDALTTERAYAPARTHEDALAEILAVKGVKFDPYIVLAFEGIQTRFRNIADEFRDTKVGVQFSR